MVKGLVRVICPRTNVWCDYLATALIRRPRRSLTETAARAATSLGVLGWRPGIGHKCSCEERNVFGLDVVRDVFEPEKGVE